jgi:replicative DNA helicase
MNDKSFPSAVDTERSLLGCILLDPLVLQGVTNLVGPGDFYAGKHRRLYELLLRMREAGDAIDMMTVGETVASSEDSDRAYGGAGYVLGLPDRVATTLNAESYALTIRQYAVRRMLVMSMKALALKVHDSESELDGVVTEIADLARRASLAAPGKSLWKDMPQVIEAHDHELAQRIDAHENKRVIGVPTGIGDVDHLLQGLRPGKLYILAARPAMGKSALASNIMTNASRAGHRCAEYSLEMGDVELLDRQIADVGGVDYGKLQRGMLDEGERRQIEDAKELMWSWPLHLDDTATRTIDQICAGARQLKAKHPDLQLIVIDYLQLASSASERGVGREQEVAKISRGLKLMARELDVAVLCLGQLNRECEKRPNKRPLMSDLRESGAIEQDADCVMFIYRDEYYNPESQDQGIAEVIVRKHRGFPTGTVKTAWTPEHQRFSALARYVEYRPGEGYTVDPEDGPG